MFIDSPSRKLVVVLNAAAVTKDMPVIVDYVDITATTTTPAPGYARTNGTTPVDILVGPTAGTQRKVNGLTIYNSDTAVKTVKVYTVDNPVGAAALTGGFEYQIISLGTTDFTLVGAASNTIGVIFVPTGPGAGTGTASPVYPAIDVTLQVDDTLGYTDVNGWYALDMSGNLKTVVGTSASAIADAINTAPAKTTPVGADKIGIWDSVSGLLNSVSFTNALNWFAAKLGNAANVFSVALGTSAAHAARTDQVSLFPTVAPAASPDIFGASGATINLSGAAVTITSFTACTTAQIGSVKRIIPAADANITASANLIVDSKTSGTYLLPANAIIEVLALSTTQFKVTTVSAYGTWTATLTASITGPTTPITVSGFFTKSGKFVNLQATFTNVDTTGASGQLQITGSPFTAGYNFNGTASKAGIGTTSDDSYMAAGSSVINLVDSVTLGITNIVAGAGKYVWVNMNISI